MVIGVIAVLAGIGFPAYRQLQARSKIKGTETLVASVAAALAGKPLTAQVPNKSALGRPTPDAYMVTMPLWDVNVDGVLDGNVAVGTAAAPGKDVVLRVDGTRSAASIIRFSRFASDADLSAALAAAEYSGFVRTSGYAASAKAINAQGQIKDAWDMPLRYLYAPVMRNTLNPAIFWASGRPGVPGVGWAPGELGTDESFLVSATVALPAIYAKQQAVKEKVGGSRFGVWSAGPDKIDNTADDIASFP